MTNSAAQALGFSHEVERRRGSFRKDEASLQSLAKKDHGCGNALQAEDLSDRALQRRFGRSSNIQAAGSFMEAIARKAARAGDELRKLDAWSLKLPQYDHTTDTCTKKRPERSLARAER